MPIVIKMNENKFEITRSFSIKKEYAPFQNFDVFCSMKEAFDKKPAPKKIEEISQELYKSCVAQVISDVWKELPKLRSEFGNKRSTVEEKKENALLDLAAAEDPDNSILAG